MIASLVLSGLNLILFHVCVCSGDFENENKNKDQKLSLFSFYFFIPGLLFNFSKSVQKQNLIFSSSLFFSILLFVLCLFSCVTGLFYKNEKINTEKCHRHGLMVNEYCLPIGIKRKISNKIYKKNVFVSKFSVFSVIYFYYAIKSYQKLKQIIERKRLNVSYIVASTENNEINIRYRDLRLDQSD